MKMSLRDFFKKGELWSGLEETIDSIKKTLNQHSVLIKEKGDKDNILLLHIKQLKKENTELKNRLDILEDKMWKLHVVSKSDEIVISRNDLAIESQDYSIKNKPNKQINRDT